MRHEMSNKRCWWYVAFSWVFAMEGLESFTYLAYLACLFWLMGGEDGSA